MMPTDVAPHITASIFDGDAGAGCLIADGGEVLAATGPLPEDGGWVQAVAAIRRDADRAARHMGLADWDALVVESEHGTLAVAPAAGGDAGVMAVVACPGAQPPGHVRRVLRRLAAVAAARLNGGTLEREP